MDSLEIKHEFECDSRLQCRTCLSIGRKLAPLFQYTDIFIKLTTGVYPHLQTQPIEICWECQSLLKKVFMFQLKVKKACELLVNNQNFIYGSLSNLASITLNDTHHKVYLNKYDKQEISNLATNNKILLGNDSVDKETYKSRKVIKNDEINSRSKRKTKITNDAKDIDDIKLNISMTNSGLNGPHTNILKKDLNVRNKGGPNTPPLETLPISILSDNNNISSDKKNKCNQNKIEENSSNEDIYSENDLDFKPKSNHTCDVKTETKPKSRWAIRRAAQNKKPKFKIVSANFGEAFTKMLISDEDLAECMAKERDSEYHQSKRFKCDTCILGFLKEKYYLKHNEIHHSNKLSAYTCDICKTKMSNKRHLSGHIAQHYIVDKCKLCSYICRNEKTKIWHFKSEHKNLYQCLKCGLEFCNRREFFKHYMEWHEKYVCDYCGVRFKMRYCVEDHIRKQHSPFTCKPCDKTFARYNSLWLHNKLTHLPATVPAYCVECDTVYKDIYRYKWHLCNSVKHSPKKKVSIPCPDCEKTFTKKVYMKDHHNLVHLNLVRYRCEQCDKNFIRNAELVKHRRRKHEGILPPRNKICYICGRGFTTNKILRNHVRTHETSRANADEDKLRNKQTKL